MTLKIIHKNNTSAGQAPASSDLDIGEIAVNSADAELYTKDTNGNIRKFQNTTTGTADGVQFTQASTGAVQRTVESKLQDTVSVKDFGAVGDGVTDDRAAVATADASGTPWAFTGGTYLINSNLAISNEVRFVDKAQLYIPSGVTVTCSGLIFADGQTAIATGPGTFKAQRYDVNIGAGETFTAIQDAIDSLPKDLYQDIRLIVADGEIFNEDLRIEGFNACASGVVGSTTTETAEIKLISENLNSATASSISSLRICGTPGMMVIVDSLKWTGTSPYDNEDATIQAYNSQALITSNDFSNVVGASAPAEASKAISSYSGLIRCSSNNYGTNVFKTALTVKGGGQLVDDGGNTGSVTEYFARTQSGFINLQRTDEVTAAAGKVKTTQDTDRGLIVDNRYRSLWGVSSFAQPYAECLDSHFESLDWLEQTTTSGGTITLNTTRGVSFQTTGGSGGSAKAEYNRFLLIGNVDWEDGITSAFWVLEAQSASSTATFYSVVGDTASSYIGFKVTNQTVEAVYNNGTGEVVVYDYGVFGRAVFGFTYSGNQIDFYNKNSVTPVVVSTANLPTGPMPDAKFQFYLNDTAGNSSYNVLSQRILFTPNNL